MQPSRHGARRILQDVREELSQVKPWALALPLPLLQSKGQARKEVFGRHSKRRTFSAPSRLILSSWRGFGKPRRSLPPAKANAPYNLYRSRFLCRCAFMRLRRLCLAIFAFLRFLSEPIQILNNCDSIESSNSSQCKCTRRIRYLVSCDGPAAAFFLSCVPIPIFFRNGSIDCLRPRNLSIDSLTSRESPGS